MSRAREVRRPTVISTFAGGGGSSQGYREAGFDERLAVEWDENACQTLRLNFPALPVYQGDIAALTVEEALRLSGLRPGELDVFDGSPPRQGFSMSGKRNLGDGRNQLFREFVRLLTGLQPRAFVMENVPGMVRGKMRVVFKEILEALEGAGYVVTARVVNAASFGVAQLRERVVFIGARADLGVTPTHPEPTHTVCPTIRKALEGVPPDDGEAPPPKLAGMVLSCWSRVKPGEDFSKVHPDGFGFNMAKCDPDRPARTITKTVRFKGWYGGIVHWKEARFLSINEVKRLAGFPDDYRFLGKFEERWARIWNCVPPPLIRAVAKHIERTILVPAWQLVPSP